MTAHKKPVENMTLKTLRAFFYDYMSGYNWVFPMDVRPYIKERAEMKRKMLKGIELWRNAATFC